MMEITTEIDKNEKELNDNQIEFWRYCKSVFSKIDIRKIGNESKVTYENDRLYIHLVHAVDETTVIDFLIDKYETYIKVAEVGRSMLMVFPSDENEILQHKTALFIEACLKGLYFKRKYTNSNGILFKEELAWSNGEFKSTFYFRGLKNSFISLFTNRAKVKIFEVNYSSFWMD